MSRRTEGPIAHQAFTLLELLAVIAVITILMALLAPALSMALARGQVTRCTSNQYQLAFALTRYDERQGCLPGWLNKSPTGTTPYCSWPVPLLPFLGRADIYDMWPTLANVSTIDTFVCPSNRPTKSLGYPVLHYAGNIGLSGTILYSGTNKNDGVFLNLVSGSGTVLSLDEIADADGTATTLAFAEKAGLNFPPHSWAYTTGTAPKGSVFGSGTGMPPVFGAAAPPGPIYPVINTVATRHFAPAGMHPGGVVVAFCDGHTAFLRDEPKLLATKPENCLEPHEYGQLLTPKSRWKSGNNITNTAAMQAWLLKNGQPYMLDETILKQ